MTGSASSLATCLPGVMRTPRTIDVELTARCNLSCTYCYFFDNPAIEYRDLPTEDWLRFFDECGELAVMDMTLAGGEPFMRRDLRALLKGVTSNGMRFSMLSNGALIDDDIAAYIAGTGRCDSIQISVDGSCPEIHDSCRGKGAFDGAVRGIRTLQRHGVAIGVRMTIHRHNVHDLENTARFLFEELGLSNFSTNAAGYLGSCRHNVNDVLLTTALRQEAMETLLDLAERYDGRISANAGPLAEARMWSKMVEARDEEAPPFSNGGHLTGCGCHGKRISVRADGAIIPCSMLAHEVLGWINRDSVQEVWQSSPALNRLRKRYTIALDDFEFCTGCPYIDYCTGNCPGLAYTLTGQVHHPSPDACLRRFLADGGALPGIASDGYRNDGEIVGEEMTR